MVKITGAVMAEAMLFELVELTVALFGSGSAPLSGRQTANRLPQVLATPLSLVIGDAPTIAQQIAIPVLATPDTPIASLDNQWCEFDEHMRQP